MERSLEATISPRSKQRLKEILNDVFRPNQYSLDSCSTKENKKLFKKLLGLAARFYNLFKNSDSLNACMYGLIFYMIQNKFRLLNWQVPYKEPISNMERKLPRLAYFSKFAAAIYGSTLNQFMSQSNTSMGDILDSSFDNRYCM